ncbi:hypothetical protein ALP55_02183 [Pseudomonas coronafaciens pv. oryzae]|nr:hypothetical protein ALP55_02183 [Pseudomonas coronafaciens pv. oryzae]
MRSWAGAETANDSEPAREATHRCIPPQPGPSSGLTLLHLSLVTKPPPTARLTVYSCLFCNITVFKWSTQTRMSYRHVSGRRSGPSNTVSVMAIEKLHSRILE